CHRHGSIPRQAQAIGRGVPPPDGDALPGDGAGGGEVAGGPAGGRGNRSDGGAMALKAKSFLYSVDSASAVATITLNRPERLNALTFEVYTELRDTFRALDTQSAVRAVIITGTGRAFCSGGDVEDIIGALFSRDA